MLCVVQLTDLHVCEDPAARLRDGLDPRASFNAVLDDVRERCGHIDAMLLTGDIADDGSGGAYRFVRDALAGAAFPVLCIPGNHDDPDTLREVLDGAPFRCSGAVPLDPAWTVELLDSHLPGEVAGTLTDASRRQLAAMRDSPDERFRLLAVHHPPVALGSAWLDECALRAPDALLDHVDADERVRAVIWGHAHQAFERSRGRVRMLGCPSTGRQFLPASAEFAIDEGRPPGYRRLGLHRDGRVETAVQWLDT
jgi:Icc protein